MWRKIPSRMKWVGAVCLGYAVASLVVWLVARRKIYLWLIWNLLLAVVPLAVSSVLFVGRNLKGAVSAILLAVWLLFLPNAFYVTTDLIHLSKVSYYEVDEEGVEVEYFKNLEGYVRMLVVFAGAVLGTAAGVMAVDDVHGLMRKRKWGKTRRLWTLAGIFVLTGLGMWMGRFLRFNSWDVWNPIYVVREVVRGFDMFALLISGVFTFYAGAAYGFYAKLIRER